MQTTRIRTAIAALAATFAVAPAAQMIPATESVQKKTTGSVEPTDAMSDIKIGNRSQFSKFVSRPQTLVFKTGRFVI